MSTEILQLAKEAKLIRSGLPLDELVRRSQLIEQLEKQFGNVKTDVLDAQNAAKGAANEAKQAGRTANTLREQVTRDLKQLGGEITKTYDKLNGPLERVTKGMDKWINLISGVLGVAGVVISLMALKASEANQAAFDRSINLAAIEGAKQGSINQLLANRIAANKAELAKTNKRIDVLNREAELASNAIKVARSWADRAYKLANDGLYESRTKIRRLNDIVAQANSNASKALQQNTALKSNVLAIDTKVKTIDVKARTVEAKAVKAESEATQARVGLKLVDIKATTALTATQQLPAKVPALAAPAINNAIAPVKAQVQQAQTAAQQAKAENPPQNQRIAELENKVRAIQVKPTTNTGNSTGTGTNAPTVNQAEVNRAVNNSIAGMGILPRLTAVQATADAALARSTAALNKPELEPIGRSAIGLGANNAAAIDKLNQDIQQLSKAPNLLEPRLTTIETKVREREKVDAAANQKLDQLVADRSKLEQIIAITGGLGLMAPQIINSLRPEIQALPGTTAAAVAAQPCNGKGCGGRTAQRVDDLAGEMGALRNQVNGLPNTVGNVVNAGANLYQVPLLNTINSKLGAPVAGGIGGLLSNVSQLVDNFSKSFERFAKWSQMDRALNLLSTIATLHNAYMLSSGLSQTLFSMISNSLALFGVKDYSQDKDGQPFDVGKIFADFTDNVAKAALGTETVDGIKTEWKKYNRIFQAAGNIVNSVQSIGYSILGALEIVANWNALVANALKKMGVVGEHAYKWFNPEVNFQNRFFTAIDRAENIVSNIDQVAQEGLSIQDTFKQFGTQQKELQDSVAQVTNSPQRAQPPKLPKLPKLPQPRKPQVLALLSLLQTK
jgi:hypothetical protein